MQTRSEEEARYVGSWHLESLIPVRNTAAAGPSCRMITSARTGQDAVKLRTPFLQFDGMRSSQVIENACGVILAPVPGARH